MFGDTGIPIAIPLVSFGQYPTGLEKWQTVSNGAIDNIAAGENVGGVQRRFWRSDIRC